MRTYIAIAALAAFAHAQEWEMDTKEAEWTNGDKMGDWDMNDWGKMDDDMMGDWDMDKDHNRKGDRNEWKDMQDLECMMYGMCDSASALTATAAVFAATVATLM